MREKIRVLVADDSPFFCRFLATQLRSAPDLQVVGTALSGPQALELARELRPDVITLAIELADLRDLDVLEGLLREPGAPVVLVSGVSQQAAESTRRGLERGAVDFLLKSSPSSELPPDAVSREIVSKVRAAAGLPALRAFQGSGRNAGPAVHRSSPGTTESAPPTGLVVLGSSIGGMVAVRELLAVLPEDVPLGVLVVQHLPPTFSAVLAEQLRPRVRLRVREARPGDRLEDGLVLVAPGDFHVLLRADAGVQLVESRKIPGPCPSIDATMQSVAQAYGAKSSAALLSGLGEDGLKGLAAIRSLGGQIYVQDPADCVVDALPQAAIDRGLVEQGATAAELGGLLVAAARKLQRRAPANAE